MPRKCTCTMSVQLAVISHCTIPEKVRIGATLGFTGRVSIEATVSETASRRWSCFDFDHSPAAGHQKIMRRFPVAPAVVGAEKTVGTGCRNSFQKIGKRHEALRRAMGQRWSPDWRNGLEAPGECPAPAQEGGRPIRRSRARKRGSDRKGSNMGFPRSPIREIYRSR